MYVYVSPRIQADKGRCLIHTGVVHSVLTALGMCVHIKTILSDNFLLVY